MRRSKTEALEVIGRETDHGAHGFGFLALQRKSQAEKQNPLACCFERADPFANEAGSSLGIKGDAWQILFHFATELQKYWIMGYVL